MSTKSKPEENIPEEISFTEVTSPKFQQITMVYTGLILNSKRKAWHRYYELTPADDWESATGRLTKKGECWPMEKAIHPYGEPGTVFTIDRKVGEDRVVPSTAKVIGRWANPNERMFWQEENRHIKNDVALEKKFKNAPSDEALREVLNPIIALYEQATSPFERSTLVLRIVKIVTGGYK